MVRIEGSDAAAIAVTRLGLGARPGEIERVAADPRGWLEAQVRPSGAPQPRGEFPASPQRLQQFQAYQAEAAQARRVRRDSPDTAPPTAPDARPAMTPARMNRDGQTPPSAAQAAFDARRDSRRALVQGTAQEFLARTRLGAVTDDGFAERWALFWANALTVSGARFPTIVFVGQYEREAIRPHVFGRFEDLLLAAEQHPAMLTYLDQARSVGPQSRAGQRRAAGLNENLAREILELHTVGSDGGYTQADVTEFARALTGWTTPRAREAEGDQAFLFRANIHEPGARTVLGKTYPAGGRAQGEAILRDLAARPETARRLARRLAVHFVADDPPPALVARLEQAWTGSRGDLGVVARALVTAPEVWTPQPAKMKTPYEFVVSTHRALDQVPRRVPALQQALVAMGQPAFSPPSPEGWPDSAADWAGPDALVKRLNWAKSVADQSTAQDPNAVAAGALGARLGDRTRQFVARAESRPEALTLFLMSPEFQRR